MKNFFKCFVVVFVACYLNIVIADEIPYDSIAILVNDKVITKNEIEIRLFEDMQHEKIPLSDEEAIKKHREKSRQLLLEEALLNSRADELQIRISDDQLENELDYFRSQRKLTEATFEDLLSRQNISLASFKKSYAERMRRNQVILREVRSKIKITDEMLQEAYDQKETQFTEVKAKHIFKKIRANTSEADKEKARQQLIWIAEQIKNGESFEDMAVKYSDDPSVKSNKGDLGFFKKDEILKAVSDVAFQLPLNVVSEPVLSKLGYHLLIVVEQKKAEKKPFKEMKEQLYNETFQKIFPDKYSQYIETLKSNAVIKYQ